MSFFVSRTVTPLLCLYWLKGAATARRSAACPARSAAALDARRRRLRARASGGCSATAWSTVGGDPGACSASSLFLKRFIGTEFFPDSRRVAVQHHLQGAHRHARRADRAGRRADRGGDQTETLVDKSGAPIAHDDDRRHRAAARAHGAVHAEHRAALGQHPGQPGAAVERKRSRRRRRPSGACGAARRAAGHAGLLLHRRHREAHPELRRAGADRRRDRRATTSRRAPRTPSRSLAQLRAAATTRTASRWLTDLQISREENYPELDVVVDRQKAGVLGPLRAADRADGADQPGRQHPVRAHPVHRREDRQRVLHQRPAGRRATGRTSTTCRRSSCARRAGGMVPLDTIARVERGSGPVRHQPQVPAAHHRRHRQRRAGQGPGRRRARRCSTCSTSCRRPTASRCGSAARPRRRQQAFGDLSFAARAGDRCSSTWCWRRSSSR